MVTIRDLGTAPFEEVHAAMLSLLADIHQGTREGEVWLVEHPPVFTAGRRTPEAALAPGVVPIERGGQVTFHGPGQLVVYPIVRLPQRDVRAWLRGLESFGVAVCAAFGLAATPSVDGTGVFVEGRKVASIGVAIRHWINLHGISINVAMDLAPFHEIAPCGLDPAIMADLDAFVGAAATIDAAKAAVRGALPDLLGT